MAVCENKSGALIRNLPRGLSPPEAMLLRNVYADKDRQEAIIKGSDMDWTIVRPSVLNNKARHNTIQTLTDLNQFRGGSISRENVATFVLDQVTTDRWLHKLPLITW